MRLSDKRKTSRIKGQGQTYKGNADDKTCEAINQAIKLQKPQDEEERSPSGGEERRGEARWGLGRRDGAPRTFY